MKQIPLTQGKFAIVDDCDFEELSKHRWLAHANYLGKFYPERAIREEGKQKTWRMYWSIVGKPEKGFCVDHIDGNPLNNQRSNLRVCTYGENNANRGHRSDNKVGLKGVVYYKGTFREPRYRAQINKNGKVRSLGYFRTPEEAHEAYKIAAKQVHGEFAHY